MLHLERIKTSWRDFGPDFDTASVHYSQELMRTTTAARTLAPSKANFFHWRTNILSSDLQRKHKYYFLASGTCHCFLCQSSVHLYTIAFFFIQLNRTLISHILIIEMFEKYGVTFFLILRKTWIPFPRRTKKKKNKIKCRFFERKKKLSDFLISSSELCGI